MSYGATHLQAFKCREIPEYLLRQGVEIVVVQVPSGVQATQRAGKNRCASRVSPFLRLQGMVSARGSFKSAAAVTELGKMIVPWPQSYLPSSQVFVSRFSCTAFCVVQIRRGHRGR